MKKFCRRCGSKLIKEKHNSFDEKTGKQNIVMVCPKKGCPRHCSFYGCVYKKGLFGCSSYTCSICGENSLYC